MEASPFGPLDVSVALGMTAGSQNILVTVTAGPGSTLVLQYTPTLVQTSQNLKTLSVSASGTASHLHVGAKALPTGLYRVASTP